MSLRLYEESVGLYAVDADGSLFQLRRAQAEEAASWQFVAPGSPLWDSIHQAIFRNHRAFPVRPEDVPPDLPPLPPAPGGPFPPWESYFSPAEPILASRLPQLARLLAASPLQGAEVLAVLHEDLYETSFGDGKFLYLVGAFLSRDEAQAHVEAHADEFSAHFIKPLHLKLDGGRITFPNFSLEMFERCNQEDVLSRLEERLRATP